MWSVTKLACPVGGISGVGIVDLMSLIISCHINGTAVAREDAGNNIDAALQKADISGGSCPNVASETVVIATAFVLIDNGRPEGIALLATDGRL